MNTKLKGECSEAAVALLLVKLGKVVLKPFGDNQRYDLLVDEGGKFFRIQVKTGNYKEGCVGFPARSSINGSTTRTKARTYKGEIEYFGVYCPQLDTVYLVHESNFSETTTGFSLRIDSPKNSQTKNINLAADFLVTSETISKFF